MDMKLEQEDRFRLMVQAQDEDRRAIRSLLSREDNPGAAPPIAHVPLMKMGPHDDPEAFVDLFEKACGWALLTGEAQVPAQQLPVANLLAYDDLKRPSCNASAGAPSSIANASVHSVPFRRRQKLGQMARAPLVRGAGGPTSLHWVFSIRAPVWSPAPGGA